MASCTTFTKDPDAVLDYTVDWAAFLVGSETIVTSSWSVPVGITEDSSSTTATAATIWLSGGSVGEVYTLTNSIITDSTPARKDDRSFMVRIANK